MADLLRVPGVNHQHAELLTESGILTIGELAGADSASLTRHMEGVNVAGKQKIAPEVPTSSEVASWVNEANQMSDIITL